VGWLKARSLFYRIRLRITPKWRLCTPLAVAVWLRVVANVRPSPKRVGQKWPGERLLSTKATQKDGFRLQNPCKRPEVVPIRAKEY
jgi:hypothetical protein